MQTFKLILAALTRPERKAAVIAASVGAAALVALFLVALGERGALKPVQGGRYAEGAVGQPIAVNPVLSANQIDKDIAALVFADIVSLAESWKISDDGKSYTVKLKDDLKWSDGQPLTTDDVAFTVDTVQNPDARSPLAKDWQGVSVERQSQLQIKFTLPAPYVFFTKNLRNTRVIPKHVFGLIPAENIGLSEFNLEPVGSGPFKFKNLSKRRDGFVTDYRLAANPHWSGKKPYIEEFDFKFYASAAELLKDLRLRNIDGFGGTLPPGADVQNMPRVAVERVPMPRYYAVFLNGVANPALRDARVRKALSLAVDREKIARDALKNAASPIASPILRDLVAFEPQNALGDAVAPAWSPAATGTASYDPEAATKAIAAYGKPIAISLAVPAIPFLQKAAEAVRADWIAAGVSDVQIVPQDTETLVSQTVRRRNYDALLFGNVLENPADLFPFLHSSQRFDPGLNLSLFQDGQTDMLLEEIRRKNDPESQTAALESLDAEIREQTPAVWLFAMPYFYAHSDKLGGFVPGPVANPADRFRGVADWYVMSARVIE